MDAVSFCLIVVGDDGGSSGSGIGEWGLFNLLLLLFGAWWMVKGGESTGMSILLAPFGVVSATVMKNHKNNMMIIDPMIHLAMKDDAICCCFPFLAQVGNCADLMIDQQC
jgi:hypothetical protein